MDEVFGGGSGEARRREEAEERRVRRRRGFIFATAAVIGAPAARFRLLTTLVTVTGPMAAANRPLRKFSCIVATPHPPVNVAAEVGEDGGGEAADAGPAAAAMLWLQRENVQSL